MKDFDAAYERMMDAIEACLYRIGAVVEGDSRHEALAVGLEAEGDFYQALAYLVSKEPYGLLLTVGSDVPYEPYVLGGKIPSWTPIEPLKAWVERKKLSWLDDNKNPLSTNQMAYIIRAVIKRRGIPARNIFKTVMDKKASWITAELNKIEVVI